MKGCVAGPYGVKLVLGFGLRIVLFTVFVVFNSVWNSCAGCVKTKYTPQIGFCPVRRMYLRVFSYFCRDRLAVWSWRSYSFTGSLLSTTTFPR